MQLQNQWFALFMCGLALLVSIEARRVRVRPIQQQEDEEETVQYYAAEPQDGTSDHRVVYISSADQYNGLYGQPAAASSRSAQQENYIPVRSTPSPHKSIGKTKQPSKEPPVQTIRNYNKVNDDGSFTFGYEAADGSFKEETRGTDCVVRGKYGYVDPDGNKREFTYVSGNPCDPNAPKEEDEERPDEDKPESGPANYPTRPIRPIRPVTVAPKPAITLFQNNYAQGQEEEEPEPEQVLKQQPQHIRARPVYISRPQYEQEPIYQRPRLVSVQSTTPSSVIYKHHSVTPINITPRPLTASSTQQPATTYRPQLLHVAVTPRPALLYTKQSSPSPRPTSTATSLRAGGSIDFDAEFQKFQQENNIVAPTPSSGHSGGQKSKAKPGGQIYSSELVFDPSSGQYNTQLYQTLPQTDGDFSLNHRIQPYVHQQQHPQHLLTASQLQNQSPLYRQFQNSAQLYSQQQKARQQQQTGPQQFYYIQPQQGHQNFQNQQQGYQAGQIDAFLRGHNIQF